MPKKFSLSPSPFQISQNRLRTKSNNGRSRSLDERSARRSPSRRISFQIREKAEIVKSPKEEQFEESAFDPWGSTSFTSMNSSTPNFSPTTVMDTPSFHETETKSTKTKSKSMSPNFHRHSSKKQSSTTHATFSQIGAIGDNSDIGGDNVNGNGSNDINNNTIDNNYNNTKRKPKASSNRIIPGVSQMTMRQTLAVIFSAFWERADLYTDVLALDHDKPSTRQLRLAFFRQGRIVLATPIESPDDMTTIDTGLKPVFAVGGGSISNNAQSRNVVQSGVKVSRKAKIKFQAINLAYDLLNDPDKRKMYNEWRLWHCRLPSPMEIAQQRAQRQQEEFEEQNQYQKLSNQQLKYIMDEGNKPVTYSYSQCSVDSNHSTTTDESSAMGSSTNSKSSLPSILRQPTFGKKKKRRNHRRKSSAKSDSSSGTTDRKIRWNEEVEELVILECSRDNSSDNSQSDLHSHDPYAKDLFKENVDPFASNDFDPYQKHSIEDDWFKQSNGETNNTIRGKGRTSFNFHSLQDSRLTFVDAQPTSQQRNTNNALDDSLIAILDAPNPPPQVKQQQEPKQQKPKSSSWTNKVGTEMKERLQTRQRPSPSPEPEKEVPKAGHHIVADDTYHVGKGNKNNVKINVRSYQKEKNINPPPIAASSINVQKATNAVETGDLFERYKEAQYEIDVDDYSIDTRSTKDTYDSYNWRSQGHSADHSFAHQNDCAVFGQSNECSPFGQSSNCGKYNQSNDVSFTQSNDCRANDCSSIDLAKGFQATLSNYINAAVSDMKQGLMNLGKKWEENVPKMSENGENPFMLNSFELDAMMDILKVEMSTIHPNMKGNCTS